MRKFTRTPTQKLMKFFFRKKLFLPCATFLRLLLSLVTITRILKAKLILQVIAMNGFGTNLSYQKKVHLLK